MTPHELLNNAKRQIINNAKDAAGSRFVSVKFRKTDGTKRTLVFNPRNIDGIKGTAKTVSDKTVRVRDAQLGQWRSFNLDRLISIKVNGTEFNFF
jgi:hypothetical protein